MKRIVAVVTFVATVAGLSLLSATIFPGITPAAWAQDAPPAADANSPLVQEGQELQAKLLQVETEIQGLISEIEGATGEDELVLTRRLSEERIKALADVGALCDNVEKQEEEGLDATAYRQRAEAWLELISSTFPRVLEALEAEFGQTRSEREGLDPQGEIEFEERNNEARERLDWLYEAYLAHVGHLEQMGLDPAPDREELSTLVTDRTKDLGGRLLLVRDQVQSLRDRTAADPGNTDLQAQLSAGELRLEGNIASLASAVNVMKALDLETAEYQKELIEVTGEISTDVLDTKVAFSLLQQWGANIRDWLVQSGPGLFFKVLLFVLILFVFRLLAGVVRKAVRKAVASSKLNFSQLLQEMIVKVSASTIFIVGLLFALSQIGFSLGPLLAGLGIAGFIVGFALQDTLANFASGVMILIYRPFDVNDLIEAGGVFGKVNHMSLVSTTILTLDHQTLIIPNGKIWGDVIKNVTAQKVRRVDMTFGVSYSDEIPKVEKVLAAILAEHPKVVDDPAPMIRLHNLGESSVDFIVRPWVQTDDYWEVYWDVTREVKMRFDREGIAIPFPQRDVHLYEEKALSPPASRDS